MWFLQADTFIGVLALGFVMMSVNFFPVALTMRLRLNLLALLCFLFLSWISLWVSAFYLAYTAMVFAVTCLMEKTKKLRRPLFVSGVLFCMAPLFFVRLWPDDGVVIIIGFAFAMLRGIDYMFYAFYAEEKRGFTVFSSYMFFIPTFTAGYTVSVPRGTFPAGQFSLFGAGNNYLFINHVDGYSLLVPRGMTVDMSFSEVGAFLHNDNMRIEIYKQDIRPMGRDSYVYFSKRFLYNDVDHRTYYRGWRYVLGKPVYVAAWSRDSLARIENDKNHYVSIDISIGYYVYTIMIKSNAPVSQLGGYEYMLQSFRLEPVTAAGYVRRSRQVNISERGWNDLTRDFFIQHFHPEAPLAWGIFTSISDLSRLFEFEEFFEYTFPILLNYSEFENRYRHPNLMDRLETAYRYGRVLVLTLQTPRELPADGSNHVYRILQGKYDGFLKNYAQTIADFGRPVMFRLGNEMNGDWCNYSAFHTAKDTVIFREWYRYVYGFFERAGANANTIWVWNPNGASFPDFLWNHELMYYPGDGYVDIVGLTKYNTGTFYYHYGERWQEFVELYEELYFRYIAIYGQPLMIPEFASASMGGCKESWVINMFEALPRFYMIKVAIWWDSADFDVYGNIARSYFIDETQGLMEIFRHHLRKIPLRGIFGTAISNVREVFV